jgi:uncharacterized protein YjiS (DUF1127 family)
MERAMTDPAQPYPFVSKLIDGFGNWLAHRREVAELDHLSQDEFGRIAHDLGIAAADLEDLVHKGPHRTDELPLLLKALGIDEASLARAEPLVMRDMERVCAQCCHKAECNRDLADGTVVQHYEAYCGNAQTIESLGQVPHPALPAASR